jgi:hypothetical protein
MILFSDNNWPIGEETLSETIFPSWSFVALLLGLGIGLMLLFVWWNKRKKR